MAFSLSLLSDPVAIYLPVSDYSLVNTEKEEWKTVFLHWQRGHNVLTQCTADKWPAEGTL